MRWPRADLEEKQEPRAATSASAERHAKGIWHDVTRKGLTEAAIEKRTFRRSEAKVRVVPIGDIRDVGGGGRLGAGKTVRANPGCRRRDMAYIQPDVLLLKAVGVLPVHRLKAWVNVLTSL